MTVYICLYIRIYMFQLWLANMFWTEAKFEHITAWIKSCLNCKSLDKSVSQINKRNMICNQTILGILKVLRTLGLFGKWNVDKRFRSSRSVRDIKFSYTNSTQANNKQMNCSNWKISSRTWYNGPLPCNVKGTLREFCLLFPFRCKCYKSNMYDLQCTVGSV